MNSPNPFDKSDIVSIVPVCKVMHYWNLGNCLLSASRINYLFHCFLVCSVSACGLLIYGWPKLAGIIEDGIG